MATFPDPVYGVATIRLQQESRPLLRSIPQPKDIVTALHVFNISMLGSLTFINPSTSLFDAYEWGLVLELLRPECLHCLSLILSLLILLRQ
jgi:hypothetical protein